MTEPIKVLTDYDEVPALVRTAAAQIRDGKATANPTDLADLLEHIADELSDGTCVEVHNPNVPNEACRQYVTGDSAHTDYGVCDSSDIWNAALRLARAATSAEAVLLRKKDRNGRHWTQKEPGSDRYRMEGGFGTFSLAEIEDYYGPLADMPAAPADAEAARR